MKVKEYLHQSDLTAQQLAEILGYKRAGTVTKRLEEELPEKWAAKLDELSDLDMAPKVDLDAAEVVDEAVKVTDQELDDWITAPGRDEDKDPNINNVGIENEVIGPQKIKLTTIRGYIEMIYGGASMIARSRGDLIASETIERYTPEYVEAWIDYIKYDERILKYLELFQVGTPLGNLVGIHAISVGAYALARITAREIAQAAAQNGNLETEI